MNAYLNYLLEASIGLCLFLLVYQLFLRKETSFRLNRMFLLIALITSVTFPLLKFNTENSPVPSINFSVEPVQELVYITDDQALTESHKPLTPWQILTVAYTAGLLIFLLVFIIRLRGMLKALKQSATYTFHKHRIIELQGKDSPFSFFNYIFIGNTPPLTEKEKRQIIEHESIHARLYHSFDIILLNILGIVFWFNPLIRVYKKIFVQLHEFEADARAAETYDVDEYCSLLAKVALHSADYKLANHFSNSLTVKRIEMMRTLKHKIKNWKVVAAAVFLPILFFVVSCQDQVESPNQSLQSSKHPVQVQKAIDRLVAADPGVEYIVVPPSGLNLKDFEGKHAKHLSYIDGQPVIESEALLSIQIGKDEKGNAINYLVFLYNTSKKNELPTEDQLKAASDVYEEAISKRDMDGEPIFSAVEMQAEAPGGIDALKERLKKQTQYPEASRRAGAEGKVFIKFVVTKDGALTRFEIVKGINQELDQEALRVLKTEERWKPGMQNGKPVHSQFVIPIVFKLP